MRYCRGTELLRPAHWRRVLPSGASTGAIAAALAVSILSISLAQARNVTFPKDEPKVVMDVPDDLTVAYTAFGLEITSPDKKLYIVADILPRNKGEADGWAKKAIAKMQSFGVKFEDAGTRTSLAKAQPAADPHAPVTSTASPLPKTPSTSSAPAQESAPAFSDPVAAAAPAASSQDPAPVFSGAPSLNTPGKPNVRLAVRTDVPAGASLEEMTIPGMKSGAAKLPFKVGHFANTTLDGQHVDVEIVDFGLSAKQLLLVLQASLRNDDRAAAIMKSMRPAS